MCRRQIKPGKMEEEIVYDYVLGRYREGKMDTGAAIRRFRENVAPGAGRGLKTLVSGRRWALVAAYGAAAVLVAFAAVRYVAPRLGILQPKAEVAAPASAASAVGITATDFVFNDASLGTVLEVLSAHYGCTLTTADTSGRLNGAFRKSDDVEVVVRAIEDALGVDIVIVK